MISLKLDEKETKTSESLATSVSELEIEFSAKLLSGGDSTFEERNNNCIYNITFCFNYIIKLK